MKICSTGITGFVGQNLTPYLADDFDVVGISGAGKAFEKTLLLFEVLPECKNK